MMNVLTTEKSTDIVLMRGISGSGKSTYVKKHFSSYSVCSADNYFMKEGKYVFYPQLLGKAHGDCLKRFIYLVQSGNDCIVVDNTNTTPIELAPYVAIASAHERPFRIITLCIDPEVAAKRNVHGVDARVIASQQRRLLEGDKNLPHQWNNTREIAEL